MHRIAERRSAIIARKALLARKVRIAALAAGMRKEADEAQSAGRAPDALDRAADLESQDVVERLQSVESRELAEIDAALKRIEKGTYGSCERCGENIGVLRLRAVPEARFCMKCSGR